MVVMVMVELLHVLHVSKVRGRVIVSVGQQWRFFHARRICNNRILI
jgi:hypothetical protein